MGVVNNAICYYGIDLGETLEVRAPIEKICEHNGIETPKVDWDDDLDLDLESSLKDFIKDLNKVINDKTNCEFSLLLKTSGSYYSGYTEEHIVFDINLNDPSASQKIKELFDHKDELDDILCKEIYFIRDVLVC